MRHFLKFQLMVLYFSNTNVPLKSGHPVNLYCGQHQVHWPIQHCTKLTQTLRKRHLSYNHFANFSCSLPAINAKLGNITGRCMRSAMRGCMKEDSLHQRRVPHGFPPWQADTMFSHTFMDGVYKILEFWYVRWPIALFGQQHHLHYGCLTNATLDLYLLLPIYSHCPLAIYFIMCHSFKQGSCISTYAIVYFNEMIQHTYA